MRAPGDLRIRLALPRADFELEVDLHLPGSGIKGVLRQAAPVSFFLLVVNLVYAFFDTFPVIDAATAGGPVQATTTLIYKIYREGFAGLDLSASAAQSVVLMFLVIVLTVVQFRYVESKVRYQ